MDETDHDQYGNGEIQEKSPIANCRGVNEDIDEEVNIPEEVLADFVNQLPERYKMVFNLYVIEEMSHKDIAALLGINEGTSKSNLARAREILKRKVKEYLDHEQ